MEDAAESEEAKQKIGSKSVVVKFPKSLLKEMDCLCDFNLVDRSEFIISAATLLLDYLDRRIGTSTDEEDWTETHPPRIDYEFEEDDVLEAAESGEDE